MSEYVNQNKADVAAVIEAYDTLVARIELTIAHLEAELPLAEATGVHRYVYRVRRGLLWARALLAVIDDNSAVDSSIMQRLMDMRHNAHQLGIAHFGKMV